MQKRCCRPLVSGTRGLVSIPAREISAACALFLKRKGTIRCTVTVSQHFSTVLQQGGLVVHIDIPRSVEICALVLRITSCFIIGKNLIWRFFYDSPSCQIKVLAKFSRYTVCNFGSTTCRKFRNPCPQQLRLVVRSLPSC